MRVRRLAAFGVLAIVSVLALPGATFGAGKHAQRPVMLPDWRLAPGNFNDGHKLPFKAGAKAQVRQALRSSARLASSVDAKIGDTRIWLALDDEGGFIYPKQYTLRGVGKHIEVWVASDSDDTSSNLNFPAGDCRNGSRTRVTDAQINGLIDAYDNNILPKESQAFSVAPARDGSGAPLAGLLGLPANYYKGDGGKTVTLVDNVRDSNFYDTNNSQGNSYIAGFFYSVFNEYFNRNVMTIDGWDWMHRTGANPPDNPVAGNLCTSAPPIRSCTRACSRTSTSTCSSTTRTPTRPAG